MNLDDILARITSKGDFGAAALGLVLGYLLELKLPVIGLQPAMAAAMGATLAVGLKSSVQAAWNHYKTERRQRNAAEHHRLELERVMREIDTLTTPEDRQLTALLHRLSTDRELWRKKLISDGDLKTTIDNFVARYRLVMNSTPSYPQRSEEETSRSIELQD